MENEKIFQKYEYASVKIRLKLVNDEKKKINTGIYCEEPFRDRNYNL